MGFWEHITVPIVVSFVTSLIVSVAGFAIGVRVGKEQTDRTALREIYRLLFQHFQEMKQSIDEGRPKRWDDYPILRDQYCTPTKKMELEGTLNQLPPKLAYSLSHVEKEALRAGWVYKRHLEEKVCPLLINIFEQNVEEPDKIASGLSYREVRASSFLFRDETYQGFKRENETNPLAYGIRVLAAPGKTRTIFAHKDKLKGNLTQAELLILVESQVADLSESLEVVQALKDRSDELGRLIKRLANGIKDPHPVSQTVVAALRDLVWRS